MRMLLLAATFTLCQLTDSTNSDVDIVNPEVTRGARAGHWGGLERTIDLSEYGVDLDKAFNRLLGPRGIVNQIALTAVTQSLVIIAYIIGGNLLLLLKVKAYQCSFQSLPSIS